MNHSAIIRLQLNTDSRVSQTFDGFGGTTAITDQLVTVHTCRDWCEQESKPFVLVRGTISKSRLSLARRPFEARLGWAVIQKDNL
jgi:hypothetical protein